MRIVVCVKPIPDPTAPASFDSLYNLDRSGHLILDEADTYGVEVAIQLVENAGAGEVVVVSMSAASDVSAVRGTLALGAARAVVVSDERLRGTDALGTAKVLTSVIRGIVPELIICATESSDGYTGTMPAQLAQLLGLPSITFAKSIVLQDDTVKVNRQTEFGYDEVTSPLPCVVTVTAGIVEPRYASFKGVMAAKSKPIEILTVSDLGLEGEVGLAGARQKVVAVETSQTRARGQTFVDEGDGAGRILSYLESVKAI